MARILSLIALLLTFAAFATPAKAGSCATVQTYSSYNNVVSTVIDPRVITVPTVFFQFINPVPLVVGAVPAVAAPAGAQAGPVGLKAESDTEKLDRLIRERLEAILKEHMGQSVGLTGDVPTFVEEGPSAELTAILPGFRQRCASCHSPANPKKGVVLFDSRGNFTPNVPTTMILAAVTPDKDGKIAMPPGAKGNPQSLLAIPPSLLRKALEGR